MCWPRRIFLVEKLDKCRVRIRCFKEGLGRKVEIVSWLAGGAAVLGGEMGVWVGRGGGFGDWRGGS